MKYNNNISVWTRLHRIAHSCCIIYIGSISQFPISKATIVKEDTLKRTRNSKGLTTRNNVMMFLRKHRPPNSSWETENYLPMFPKKCPGGIPKRSQCRRYEAKYHCRTRNNHAKLSRSHKWLFSANLKLHAANYSTFSNEIKLIYEKVLCS